MSGTHISDNLGRQAGPLPQLTELAARLLERYRGSLVIEDDPAFGSAQGPLDNITISSGILLPFPVAGLLGAGTARDC